VAALKNCPELFEDLTEVMEAYATLSYSRNMAGMIPYSEIATYAAENGIEDLREFTRYIIALEAVYHQYREAEAKIKENERKIMRGR